MTSSTTPFTRVRKVPTTNPTLRQLADAINSLIDLGWQNFGPQKVGVKQLAFADSPYTVTAEDQTLVCTTTSGVITINLPAIASSDGRVLTVIKATLDDNSIVLDGNASETINGSTTRTIQGQYSGLTIRCDASIGWDIIGFF